MENIHITQVEAILKSLEELNRQFSLPTGDEVSEYLGEKKYCDLSKCKKPKIKGLLNNLCKDKPIRAYRFKDSDGIYHYFVKRIIENPKKKK